MSHAFRYRCLGYVALNVTDLGRTSAFAEETFGLEPNGTTPDGGRRFRCSNRVNDLVLYGAHQPGFRRAGWELENENEVERAFAHMTDAGLGPRKHTEEEAAIRGFCKGLSFVVREPHSGAQFDYYAFMREKSAPWRPTVAKIERLGHFALSVPDAKVATRFYVEQLGFEVSDYVGDQDVNLMRCFPNPLHHSLGIGQSRSGKAHFNHVNFMVTDIDDIGRAFYRLRKNDVPISFGPGRHPTSDSIFIYAQDPDGMTWEYSFGMELFPEQGARKARFMSTLPEDFDKWGAMPTPDFASFGEVYDPTNELVPA